MCHRVVKFFVPRAVIHPVCPFGRPGSMTSSQTTPSAPIARPRIGRTVRSPVIGLNACTRPTCTEVSLGPDLTRCDSSSTASCWLRGIAVGAGVVVTPGTWGTVFGVRWLATGTEVQAAVMTTRTIPTVNRSRRHAADQGGCRDDIFSVLSPGTNRDASRLASKARWSR